MVGMYRVIVYIFVLLVCLASTTVQAQNDRDHIRHGNRMMRDTIDGRNLADKAIVQYKKAIEKNQDNAIAHYNLACALIRQGKLQDAMRHLQKAARLEKDTARLSDIYHNMGVLLQNDKQFDKAIIAYRQSLRMDPTNNYTRYNYVLCQRQLKDQKDNKDQNKQNQNKNQQNKQDQQKQNQPKPKENKDAPPKEQPQPNQMSKENADQLLKAAMQNEKQTQQKLQRQQQNQPKKHLDKQW